MLFYRTNVRGISRTVWGLKLDTKHKSVPKENGGLFLVPLWVFEGTGAHQLPGFCSQGLTLCILKDKSFYKYIMDSPTKKAVIRRMKLDNVDVASVINEVNDFLVLLNSDEGAFNIHTGHRPQKMFYRNLTIPKEICKFICNFAGTSAFQDSGIARELKHNTGALEFIKEHTKGTGAFSFLPSPTPLVSSNQRPCSFKERSMSSTPKPVTVEKFKFIATKQFNSVVSAEFTDQQKCQTAAAEFVSKGYDVEVVKVISRANTVTKVVWS